ncbi:MAG: hypothetical protein IKR59_01295, partial [Lachnospiraceae bacterium]|nr:hypothetical protein [Lachnospiraceae bacterium]
GELDASLRMNSSFTSSPLALPTPEAALLTLDEGGTILLPDTITFDMLEKRVDDVEDGKLITYIYKDFPLGSVRLSLGEKEEYNPIFRAKKEEQLVIEAVEPIAAIDGWLVVALTALLLILIMFIILTAKAVTPRKKYR